MPGIESVQRLVNRGDGAVRAVLVNGRLAWGADGRADDFGVQHGFGKVLRSAPR